MQPVKCSPYLGIYAGILSCIIVILCDEASAHLTKCIGENRTVLQPKKFADILLTIVPSSAMLVYLSSSSHSTSCAKCLTHNFTRHRMAVLCECEFITICDDKNENPLKLTHTPLFNNCFCCFNLFYETFWNLLEEI